MSTVSVFKYTNNEVTGTVVALRGDQPGKLKCNVEKGAAVIPPADDFPDGGLRAWLIVLGTMCGAFSTFGLATSWGVFQAYYEQTILPDTPPSDIAWIGSIQFSLILLPGLVTGRLFDIGYFKLPLFIASVILVVSTFLVAECTEYWQFLLCQGFTTGLSAGIIFGPMMGILGHWFKKRRGLVLGMCAVGSAIGGLLLPIIVRNLINRVGFQWTMRSLGFIFTASLGCTNLLLERRLPPVDVTGGLFNFAAFKSLPYSLYCLSTLFTFLGMYTMVTFIDISAEMMGMDANLAFYFVAIINGSSGVSRCISGILADRLGPVNIIVPMSVLCAVMTSIWPFMHNTAGLVVICIIYGMTIGTYVSAFLMPVFSLGSTEDVGRRTGMTLTIAAIGALAGPPMAGAILKATGGFGAVGFTAGAMVLISVGCMLGTQYLVIERCRA